MIPTLKMPCQHTTEENPTPSVVFPKPFKVLAPPLGSHGACSSARGLFGAPLDNSPASCAIRAHEYGHLTLDRIQPQLNKIDDKLSNDWMQAGMDNIVNGFCESVDVSIKDLPIPPMNKIPAGTSRRVRATYALQLLSVKTPKKLLGLSEADEAMLRRASKQLKHLGRFAKTEHINHEQVLTILHNLETYFGLPPTTDDRKDLEILMPIPGELMPDLSLEKSKPVAPAWCPCSMEARTLDKSINRRLLARKRIAGFCGAFRNPVRTLIPAFDGMGWSINAKKLGGTILLDQSSSMHIEEDHLRKLLEDAPHATIAGYSGARDVGTIRILAHAGRYTSNCLHPWSGNSVDGPALRWLASQGGPRVWISDGHIVGAAGSQHPILKMECATICTQANILRVGSIEEYFRLAKIKL